MNTDTTNSQAASFRAELLPILRNMYLHFEPDAIDDEICSVLDMIDAKLAQAGDDWRDRANVLEARLGEVMEKRDELRERAIAAESRLAEIQRGVEGLRLFACFEVEDGVYEDKRGSYYLKSEVLALLQPQGQADTSGLSG